MHKLPNDLGSSGVEVWWESGFVTLLMSILFLDKVTSTRPFPSPGLVSSPEGEGIHQAG